MERNTDTLYILRFLAALVVILYHYSPPAVSQHILFVIKNGNEAVNFFFFLSGFVMVVSNRAFFRSSELAFPKREFYIKRFARIYPLYLLAILLLLLFHFGIKRIDTATVIYRMPFELAAIQRWFYAGSFNYPGWSISCEFLFYLLFPVIANHLRNHRTAFTRLALSYFLVSHAITAQLAACIKTVHQPLLAKLTGALYMNPMFLISIFILGTLAGKHFIDRSSSLFKQPWLNRAAIVISLVVILLTKYEFANGSGLLKGGLLAPVYFVFVLAITSFNKADTAMFSSTLFVFLGEISYGMYILQYPVYVFYTHYVAPLVTAADLFIFIAVLIAFVGLVHTAIEKPFRNVIIKRFTGKAHVTRG